VHAQFERARNHERSDVYGVWTVAPNGAGTLFRQKTGTAHVPLSAVATISIRKVTPEMNPPFFNILQACGEINVNPN